MECSRREFGTLTLAGVPAALALGESVRAQGSARRSTRFGGLNVGLIAPYSFRGMPGLNADSILANLTQLGLNAVELQNGPVEAFAGAPATPPTGVPFGTPLNAEQQAVQAKAREALRAWRLTAPMTKFRELKAKYDAAGVKIDLVKFMVDNTWPDAEVTYAFEVAKALGCRGITCEPPLSHTKRLAAFAEKYRIMLGYHGHVAVTDVEAFARPGSWEQAFFYSKYNGANIDIGHYTAANATSVVDFIREHHERITNLHLKDRKKNGGPNVPWGEGDTPIREVLRLMQREKYTFMATIELEYPIPAGSDAMTELARCARYIEDSLRTT